MKGERSVSRGHNREDFVVRVFFNEHATWQGEVVWVEKQERHYFRSALELLRLMDNAMETSHVPVESECEWA